MYLKSSTVRIAGLLMILTAILTIVTVAFTIAGSNEKDPFDRDEVAEFLTETADSKTELRVAAGVGVANDAFIGPLLVAAIYILFRDRSRLLATMAMLGLFGALLASALTDGLNFMLTVIAEDYVKGGVGGAPSLDPAALEVGRYIAITGLFSFQIVFTLVGAGLIPLGLLIARAPAGAINPPRWLGWVALASGVSAIAAWLVIAADPFFVFFPIQLLTLTVFFVGTGYWLLTHADLEPSETPAPAM